MEFFCAMKLTKNFGTAFSLLFFLMGTTILLDGARSVNAATVDEIRAQIKNKMADRHPGDSSDFWSQLGPTAVPVIEQMYGETQSVYQKSWLIDGMAHFQDPSIGTLLEDQIQSDGGNDVLKRKMLDSLVESQGDTAAAFAEPYLKDSDAQTRLAVARALKKYTTNEQTKKKLSDFDTNEKLAWVKTDYEKADDASTGLLKRNGSIYAPGDAPVPLPTPLPEKAWAGEWKGIYVTADKSSVANLTLKLLKEKATPAEQKWKIELKLPKQTAYEIKEKNVEIVYYQTAQGHWLEIRNKKEDSVFIAQKLNQKLSDQKSKKENP
jgi:hypothetical protein